MIHEKTDSVSNEAVAAQTYILHFDRPYWGNARHYVGMTTIGAENRIKLHRKGRGSLLVNYALNKLGINFSVGLIEDFSCKELARWHEKRLKKEAHLSRHCKICREWRKANASNNGKR